VLLTIGARPQRFGREGTLGDLGDYEAPLADVDQLTWIGEGRDYRAPILCVVGILKCRAPLLSMNLLLASRGRLARSDMTEGSVMFVTVQQVALGPSSSVA
jgi:hypothetical protein